MEVLEPVKVVEETQEIVELSPVDLQWIGGGTSPDHEF